MGPEYRLIRAAALTALLGVSVCGARPSHSQPASTNPSALAGERYTSELAPGIVFEVIELHRLTEKNVVQLKFTLANSGRIDTTLAALGVANSMWLTNIELIDFLSKKAYKIGEAARCLCSTFGDGGAVAAGGRREFWAWFALPPGGVKTLSVQVGGQPPILDVPLL